MNTNEAIAKFDRFQLKVERELENWKGWNDPNFLEYARTVYQRAERNSSTDDHGRSGRAGNTKN
jgi:hypothetical protein